MTLKTVVIARHEAISLNKNNTTDEIASNKIGIACLPQAMTES
jgi:hypothetical protein